MRFRTFIRFLGLTLVWAFLLLATLWAVLALYIDVRVPKLQAPLALMYGLAMLAIWLFAKRRGLAKGVTLAGFVLVFAWWLTLEPSNERDWQPDLVKLAYAEINGDEVTLHNIRNCEYRSETDFDVRHYDKTFDLDKLRSVDLYMVYWGSPHMAHTMVSFGFEGGEYVCVSIETRKELGESYSAVRGLFRQFELVYVVGDERDLVRLRTNVRQGEDAYLYRIISSPQSQRQLFLDYVRRVNELAERPEWYSAITHNCTTSIRMQRAAADRVPWDWRLLVNGYGNELLHEHGAIATELSAAEMKERCRINDRAMAADRAADFSRRIREGLPGVDP